MNAGSKLKGVRVKKYLVITGIQDKVQIFQLVFKVLLLCPHINTIETTMLSPMVPLN